MKNTIEIDKNREMHTVYFDPGQWSALDKAAREMSTESGRRITASTLLRIAIRDLLKKING
jgi:hypothetical protein